MPHQQADHLCPPWVGLFLLANPLRRLQYTPQSVLGPHVTAGMTVVEPGPGMGFFTLWLARAVGPGGRVIAVDVQEKMLQALERRARRAGLTDRLDLRVVKGESLGLDDVRGKADFFLAFFMVHEVPDPGRFFVEAYAVLRPGGRLLFSEPRGHTSAEHFSRELDLAQAAGFRVESRPTIRGGRSALLVKG